MARAVLLFSSNAHANHLIAGIPAAVRAAVIVHQSQSLGNSDAVIVAVPGGWKPTKWAKSEFARLLPDVRIAMGDPIRDTLPVTSPIMDASSVLCGEPVVLASSDAVALWLEDEEQKTGHIRLLNTIGSDIIRATGKQSDGLVSRYLNRPISRFISKMLLKFPGVTPMHATALAAFTGLLMALFLAFGGAAGLVAGALLFHAASVIDGVDGEIARATKRSSEFGAKLDTIIDGITNLAFLSLASLNLWLQGEVEAATYGAAGLAILATGLTALGARSIAMGGPFTFDAVKNNFHSRPSKVTSFLAAITSRDVYAAIFALTYALGLAKWMLLIFASAAAIWLVTVLIVLVKTRAT